ncbi:type I-C CRISPR-associated protein Cas8c/Csd1 [Agarivorans sp. Z349TD_8]|uniref:type I-C CRISPR-associated protein Cas8c/Csd1 n=1 Tax=Agarivorans sp. Z349TD_8 TaxID=3421434 RepID=UPI003D7CE123
MSWMERLYRTYDQALELEVDIAEKLSPICHTVQNAHINIVINGSGEFRRASVLEKTQILLPATEKSAGRTSGEEPHPLSDKLQYVAGDYSDFGGLKGAYFGSYQRLLNAWVESDFSHPSLKAVLAYISRKRVIQDLVEHQLVYLDDTGQLLTQWADDKNVDVPQLVKILPKDKKKFDFGSALVCWTVESSEVRCPKTWLDPQLYRTWNQFLAQSSTDSKLCLASGHSEPIALNHPAKLRHSGDKAKLISANDLTGFTFKGRFTDTKKSVEKHGYQGAAIGSLTTQKAHNALRWLIERQGKRNGDQVIVAWAVSCTEIPSPLEEPFEYDLDDLSVNESAAEVDVPESKDFTRDLGFTFAQKLNQTMAGYKAKLDRADDTVVVMAIDSATPGRMGVVYYREHAPHDYIDVVARWHRDFAWPQRHKIEIPQLRGKPKETTVWLPFAPTPWLILNTAYGDIIKSNETLKKNLYERLLPCIVEGRNIPLDILNSVIRSVSNTQRKRMPEQYSTIQSEQAAWERDLGVACALYRGFYQRQPKLSERRKYSMALDRTNTSRDYLYGRLLAMAERIESVALNAAKVNRPTTANRLMQRFADRPFSTWRTVNQQLQPYLQQLQNSRTGFLVNSSREMDDIMGLFWGDDFTNDKALSGEYLLGFHCQRLALRESSTKSNTDSVTEIQEG